MVNIKLRCPACRGELKEMTVPVDGGDGIREIIRGVWYCSYCETLNINSVNKIMNVPKTFDRHGELNKIKRLDIHGDGEGKIT